MRIVGLPPPELELHLQIGRSGVRKTAYLPYMVPRLPLRFPPTALTIAEPQKPL